MSDRVEPGESFCLEGFLEIARFGIVLDQKEEVLPDFLASVIVSETHNPDGTTEAVFQCPAECPARRVATLSINRSLLSYGSVDPTQSSADQRCGEPFC